MEILSHPQFWLSLLTLTFLEIVLGVDNLVFISIVSSRVAKPQQKIARRAGLIGALLMRLALLASIFWIIGMTKPLFSIWEKHFSIRDLILIAGGVFLLFKATVEIHHTIEEVDEEEVTNSKKTKLWVAISQIMIFDIVFSLDSILTAIGLTEYYFVMALAILIAIIVMLIASEPLHAFIQEHPTIKMLALSFLLLIGLVLIADGFSVHIPREYVYFAIAFSIFVELMNNLARKKKKKARQ